MFNFQDAVLEGNKLTTTGTVPVLLNGELANLIFVFEDDISTGKTLNKYIAGVRYDYAAPEGEDAVGNPVAKTADLAEGDVLQFVADYYTKDGEYEDTYRISEEIEWTGDMIIGYIDMSDLKNNLVATFLFTDIYNNEHWSAALDNVPLSEED